jgi:hypothetical protein
MTKAPSTAAKAIVAGMERIAMTPSDDPRMRTLTRLRTEKKFGA